MTQSCLDNLRASIGKTTDLPTKSGIIKGGLYSINDNEKTISLVSLAALSLYEKSKGEEMTNAERDNILHNPNNHIVLKFDDILC